MAFLVESFERFRNLTVEATTIFRPKNGSPKPISDIVRSCGVHNADVEVMEFISPVTLDSLGGERECERLMISTDDRRQLGMLAQVIVLHHEFGQRTELFLVR